MVMLLKKVMFVLTGMMLAIVCHAQQIFFVDDTGWRLWPDTAARWEHDRLYLPGEFHIAQLPVNPPSASWDYLTPSHGIEVTLPATVEQYFWGHFGYAPYKEEEYGYTKNDNQVKNGSYKGVSWWWKEIFIPREWAGKTVLLKIRGARLRAEVYMNRKLVGYNIISEVSFDCDVSKALEPGKNNLLAIRITNPGGEMDWIDPVLMQWGEYSFHRSHGFGGLDRGIALEAHDPVFIHDSWVLNHPQLNKITACCRLVNVSEKPARGTLSYELYNENNQLISSFKGKAFALAPFDTLTVMDTLVAQHVEPWSVDNPRLYRLRTLMVTGKQGKSSHSDVRERTFGFRWFDAEGTSTNAILTFNHQRIRLLSAISWGFWGLNGLFPTPELARKEVVAAKTLGLNCLQFHRNIGKTEVLDWQDKLGLLRYMEPGGGRTALDDPAYPAGWGGKIHSGENFDTGGKEGAPRTFAQRYMEEKIIRMIRDHRSHPSLIMYVIQNEMAMSLANPRIWHLFRRMQAEDPSRIIVLKSGVDVFNQVWAKPYSSRLMYDQGDGFSGWMDQHTVGGPGVWKDDLYRSPEEFTHKAMSKTEIMMWGEMLGCAVPDNHEKMIEYIDAHGGKSYDREDHQEVFDAYKRFLNRWGFSQAFPSASDLFTDIGRKSYDFWGRVIETARLSEENDYLVISGWESTAIENHSGLVDNQRNLRCEPSLLSKKAVPFSPVIKAHSRVIEQGKEATMDLFIINETHQQKRGNLSLKMISPQGEQWLLGNYLMPSWQPDTFVYLIARNVKTHPLLNEGKYILQFYVEGSPDNIAEEELLVIRSIPDPSRLPQKVAYLGNNKHLFSQLEKDFGIKLVPFNPDGKYDLIITSHSFKIGSVAKISEEIKNTSDDFLYQSEIYGDGETMEFVVSNVPAGKTKVTLKFCEAYFDRPKERIFDVAINGQVVLDDFDIYAEGGKYTAVDKEFLVDNKEGKIVISFPEIKANMAKLCAFKVESRGKTMAYNCGGNSYTDAEGIRWEAYLPGSPFDSLNTSGIQSVGTKKGITRKVLYDAVRSGTNLLMLPVDEGGVISYGESLKAAGVLRYDSIVGKALAPWMGSWVFVRQHPVYEGLPVNTAMKSEYQVGAMDANGMIIDGNNVEVIAGYGRDHNRNIGAASFIASYGKGKILVHCLYGLSAVAPGPEKKMQPVIARRLLYNSLVYLNQRSGK